MAAQENPVSATMLSVFSLLMFCLVVTWSPNSSGRAASGEEMKQLQEDLAVLREEQRWKEAELSARQLHELVPKNHIYIQALAEIYERTGRVADEAKMWELFVQYAPLPVEACPHWPRAYEALGDIQRSLQAYARCLSFDRTNSDNAFFMAHAYEKAGMIPQAVAEYERAHEANPKNGDIRVGLARMLIRQNRPKEAKVLAEEVLKVSPRQTDALLVMGLACRQLGDLAAAREFLRRGSILSDGDNDFHLMLAAIAEEVGDPRDAIEHYKRAVRSDRSPALAERLRRLENANR